MRHLANEEVIKTFNPKFRTSTIESAFQAHVHRRNLKVNAWGIGIGLSLFIIYIFSDFLDTVNPTKTVLVRSSTFALCALLFGTLLLKAVRQRQDTVFAMIVFLLTSSMNVILWLQPSLDNTWYLGLIQCYIMAGVLLRLSFLAMAVITIVTLGQFVAVAFSFGDSSAALLQSANVAMVGMFILGGVYLVQRYQREDFLKSQTIEVQNEKLQGLLEDTREDNTRKLAAMNTLVHFVKTPLHQISGYSDILMSSLSADPTAGTTPSDGLEGARYIKEATQSLNSRVNDLLTYHRLDETDGKADLTSIPVLDLFDEFEGHIGEEATVRFEGEKLKVLNREEILRTAISCLARHLASKGTEKVSFQSSPVEAGECAEIVIETVGGALSSEEFEEASKPLTKIDNYLTANGADMPMKLRTVARALEIAGGELSHEEMPDGNRFRLRVKDYSANSVTPLRAAG